MMEKKLPEGWEWTKLSKICEKPQYGYTTSAKHDGIPPQLLRTTDISKGEINWGSVPFCSEPPIDEERYLLREGDILIARAGSVGASIVVRNPPESIFASYLIRFRPKEILNPMYAGFFLRSNVFWAQLGNKTAGTTLLGVNATNLSNVKIPLPPLETQHMIVTILEKTDETKRLRMQADELTNQLLQSVFLEMFGDPVKNPKGWEVKTLGDICTLIKDGPHVSPNYVEEGVPFITVHNIIKGFFDLCNVKYISKEDHTKFCKRCKPEKGDVLYSKGGTTGFAKRVDVDFEFSIWVHLALLKFPKDMLNPIFLETCLNSNYCKVQAKRYTRGIANRDLVLSQMAKIKIIVPLLSIQQKFAQIVEKVEAMRQNQKQSQQEIDTLFNALMQKAFVGELIT